MHIYLSCFLKHMWYGGRIRRRRSICTRSYPALKSLIRSVVRCLLVVKHMWYRWNRWTSISYPAQRELIHLNCAYAALYAATTYVHSSTTLYPLFYYTIMLLLTIYQVYKIKCSKARLEFQCTQPSMASHMVATSFSFVCVSVCLCVSYFDKS